MSRVLPILRGIVKVLALLLGSVATLVCLMALIGHFSAGFWLRLAGALVLMIAPPALLADRLLPKDDPTSGRGIPSDVFALSWLGVPVLLTVVLGGSTRGSLLREAEREATAGHNALARIAMALAGDASGLSGATPAASSSATASAAAASASSVPLALPSASAAPAPSVAPEVPPPVKPSSSELSPAELFKRLAPAVVTVTMLADRDDEIGGGTGFMIDAAGTLVTNHHVIAQGKTVSVKFIDGALYEDVSVLADDPTNDLALLHVALDKPKDGKPPTFEPLKLGDSDAVVVGERAISIGNPLGLDHTLTDGLVSARRMYEGKAWIQMSVPVSPGNSGGPLFDMRGNVIGVTTAQIGGMFGRAQNLNLAIPSKVVSEHVHSSYPDAHPFGKQSASGHW